MIVNGSISTGDEGEIGINTPSGFDDFEDLYQVTLLQPGLRINLREIASDCDLYLIDPSDLSFIEIADTPGGGTPAWTPSTSTLPRATSRRPACAS